MSLVAQSPMERPCQPLLWPVPRKTSPAMMLASAHRVAWTLAESELRMVTGCSVREARMRSDPDSSKDTTSREWVTVAVVDS